DLDLDLGCPVVAAESAPEPAAEPPARGTGPAGLCFAVDAGVGGVLFLGQQRDDVQLGGGLAALADVAWIAAAGQGDEVLAVGGPQGVGVTVDFRAGDALFLAAVCRDDVDVRQQVPAGPRVRDPLAVGRPLRVRDGKVAEAGRVTAGNDG